MAAPSRTPAPTTPTRRGVLLGGAAAAGLLATSAAPAAAAARSTVPSRTSVTRGYAFLAERFDQYGSGTQLRVPRSYQGGYFSTPTFDFVSSFAYDDALVVLAWLAGGAAADLQRATVLGDALLYAQANDPLRDGRTRASYQPDPFVTADGTPQIGSPAANTGNQAWVGLALARLFAVTRQQRFLDGALRSATWIQERTFDGVRAPFGYTGGRDGNDVAYAFKATEHNIDVGAFFTMLATLTGDSAWSARARTAFAFVASQQDPGDGHVWTGTDPDGTTTNRFPIPADVQTWAYLATGDPRYSASLTWVFANLTASDAGFTGSSYSDADVSKVWFEGSAHLALAVRARGATGDAQRYADLMASAERAQATAANGDGRGLVAASSDGLDTGFGDLYYASLHTGATAWYLMAAKGYNPFRL
ncbi:MAG: hypothetical protein AVDCRST_MAG35-261 [uncultured Quadrisphaera sp.]|uniref:Tat pathway signal sequence domain protein n=1 Tax=uncultured Quadrisphaera sp. TaxID=904978 RepID=A0A6J4NN10_9ACTN|nr:MAG: hypothetical protein AVDCRST_MAG35-261 [uncultured Quadrisphaera sp.]